MKQFKKLLSQLAQKIRKQSQADDDNKISKYDLVLELKSERTSRKPSGSDSSEIQAILKKLAIDTEFLKVIRQKPQALMEEFDLAEDDIKALRLADLLITARSYNPLLQANDDDEPFGTLYLPDGNITGSLPDTGVSTITNDTGSTCTVTNNGSIVSMASTVQSLKEKDSIYLADLVEKLVEDEEFYGQVRSYFGH